MGYSSCVVIVAARAAPVVWVRSLAWELLYAVGSAEKKIKKEKKKKESRKVVAKGWGEGKGRMSTEFQFCKMKKF